MENLIFYFAGAMVVAAISFTIAITSIALGLREYISKIHHKLEELIHCPWCLSFWMLLILINIWSIPMMNCSNSFFLNMFFTVFSMYSVVGVIHYVLLRTYAPVTEIMMNRMQEKRQEARKQKDVTE